MTDEPFVSKWSEQGLSRLLQATMEVDSAVNYLNEPAMLSVIGRLREREQVALLFRFQYGYTLDAIAQRFKITRERIRQIIARAKRRIRGQLGPSQFRKDAHSYFSFVESVVDSLLR